MNAQHRSIILIGQSGGEVTILFDKLWDMMKAKGISTYQLREKCGINGKTVRCLRANDNMETKTLSKLCSVLDCRLEDIAEYVPDELQLCGSASAEL